MAELVTQREGEGTRYTKYTAQEVRRYLAKLGVEVSIDLETERLYVVSIEASARVTVPKTGRGIYLEPGDRVIV
jgi:hypothetical protein